MVICCCDGTFDGILTAVFEAWVIDVNTTEIAIGTEGNMVLFAEYKDVVTDTEKAARVARSIISKISHEAYETIYKASLSEDPERGNAILGFIRRGFSIGRGVVHDLANPSVLKVFELSRNTGREAHHYLGFLRFMKHEQFLLAKLEPKNDIMTLITDHFTDRLEQENFLIVDMRRAKAAVHRASSEYFITDVDLDFVKTIRAVQEEDEYRQLWEVFENTIAIEARVNLKLQKQNMPLRYRKYMDIRN